MTDDLTIANSELLCIDQCKAAAFGQPEYLPPTREHYGSAFGVVEIVGTLYKWKMVEIGRRIRRLAADPSIGQIILLTDSPGGSLAGTHELCLTVRDAAARKPVINVIEDACCSGALYATCHATECIVGEASLVGSIGVFCLYIDRSKLLENLGIRVIRFASGKHKGAGAEASGLTDEQHVEIQSRINRHAEIFIAAVASGRKTSPAKIREIADGRVYVGVEGVAVGLADRVGRFDDVLRAVAESGRRRLEIQRVESLTGYSAVRKYEELVAAEELARASSQYPRGAALLAIEQTYPRLTAAAKEFRR